MTFPLELHDDTGPVATAGHVAKVELDMKWIVEKDHRVEADHRHV